MRPFAILLSICCLLVTISTSTFAADSAAGPRPKIGLALSGGGARGSAHLGVIKVLEEMRIPIDCIAGTSMGAIVGGLYASGMSVEDLEKTLTSIDWADAFNDNIPRADRSFRRKSDDRTYLIKNKPGLSDDLELKLPSGLLQGQKIDILFQKLSLPVSTIGDFDNLKIPFRVVTTDIVTGESVALGSGDLALSMRASMSVPAAFSPVEIGGRLLVDGGVSDNLPVDVVRAMGAQIIIAVDISTPLRKRDELGSSLAITGQLTGFLTRRNTEAQIASLTDNDILLVPDLGEITTTSFNLASKAIPKGAKAAEEKRQDLARLSLSEEEYAAYKSGLSNPETSIPVVDFVRLDNQSRVSDAVLLARLHVKEGQPLDVAELETDIGKIYGMELFENIRYEIVDENGKTGVVIHAKEKSWGPNYVQLGLSLAGNEKGDSTYNLALAYTRTAINRLNGEWRTAVQVGNTPLFFTEIYQPLDIESRYFINPKLLAGRRNVSIYSRAGDRLADYSLTRYGGDLAVGRELGTWGEARTGIRRMVGHAEVKTGQSDLPDYDYDLGQLYVSLSSDKLDNLDFPRKGYYFTIEYLSSLEDVGADTEFEQLLIDLLGTKSWGRYTIIGRAKYFSTIYEHAPIESKFQLGGLFNLAGYVDDELSGQQLSLLQFAIMRRIGDFNLMPTYLGVTLESGNVWEEKSDVDFEDGIFAGSLFIGIKSIFGPIYAAYGLAENNHNSFYFYLGRTFH